MNLFDAIHTSDMYMTDPTPTVPGFERSSWEQEQHEQKWDAGSVFHQKMPRTLPALEQHSVSTPVPHLACPVCGSAMRSHTLYCPVYGLRFRWRCERKQLGVCSSPDINPDTYKAPVRVIMTCTERGEAQCQII